MTRRPTSYHQLKKNLLDIAMLHRRYTSVSSTPSKPCPTFSQSEPSEGHEFCGRPNLLHNSGLIYRLSNRPLRYNNHMLRCNRALFLKNSSPTSSDKHNNFPSSLALPRFHGALKVAYTVKRKGTPPQNAQKILITIRLVVIATEKGIFRVIVSRNSENL